MDSRICTGTHNGESVSRIPNIIDDELPKVCTGVQNSMAEKSDILNQQCLAIKMLAKSSKMLSLIKSISQWHQFDPFFADTYDN